MDLKELSTTTTPTPPPPQSPVIGAALLVAVLDNRFNDLKKETVVSLKSFADAVKASAPAPPQKPKLA